MDQMKLKPILIRTWIYAAIGLAALVIGFLFMSGILGASYNMTRLMFSTETLPLSIGLSLLLFALLTFLFREKLNETPHIITSLMTILTSASISFFVFLRFLIHVFTEGDVWKESIPASLIYLVFPLAFAIGYWLLRRKRFKVKLIVFDGLTLILFLFPFFNLFTSIC